MANTPRYKLILYCIYVITSSKKKTKLWTENSITTNLKPRIYLKYPMKNEKEKKHLCSQLYFIYNYLLLFFGLTHEMS